MSHDPKSKQSKKNADRCCPEDNPQLNKTDDDSDLLDDEDEEWDKR